MAVSITNDDLVQIKKYLGYPQVNEILLTDDDIKNLCILPSLWEYFSRFPIHSPQEIKGTISEILLDFPDEYTFSVLNIQVLQKGNFTEQNNVMNLLSTQAMLNTGVAQGFKVYSTKRRFNPSGLFQQRYKERYLASTLQNKSNVRYDIFPEDRKVRVYMQNQGTLLINWAKWSDDFSMVRFERKQDVIKLSASKLMRHFVDLTNMKPAIGDSIDLDYGKIAERADKLETEVMEKWINFPNIFINYL